MKRDHLVKRAVAAKRESRYVDFKETFDPESKGEWCELIKDIVAMANSGGGVLVFGVRDNGTTATFDHTAIMNYDSAKIVDKIASYTSRQFSEFEVLEVKRGRTKKAALVISDAGMPMVFMKAGKYQASTGREKVAFQKGVIYFRHGAKSEPCTHDDLGRVIERLVDQHRRSWLENIRKMVKAPPGQTVTLVDSAAAQDHTSPLTGRVVPGKDAPAVYPVNADQNWPHRGIDIIREVNRLLDGKTTINSYDMLAVRKVYDLEETRRDLVYRPFKSASAQYSEEFLAWLIGEFQGDPQFFEKARDRVRAM